jgi:hypothetical protein
MNAVLNPIHKEYGFPCPLTLTCTVTGDSVVYSDPEYIKGRIEKAGSLETLVKTYVSKAGKRQLNGAKPAKQGRSWKGSEIIQPTTEVKEIPAQTSPERISILYLQDRGDFSWISRVDCARQNPEQKAVTVHDHRKDKSSPFKSAGFFPSTIKELKDAGVVLAVK